MPAGGLMEDRPPARAPSLIHSRHSDRDYGLRRLLVAADAIGLAVALAASLLISGNRTDPLGDAVWILPTLPAWGLLFRAYGLYRRPLRRFEPTHLDDLSSLLHAMVFGILGLWLFYKLIPPAKLEFKELLIFLLLALPLVAASRVGLRIVNLHLRGPERVFVVAPIDDVRALRRKLRNHPEYEMEVVGAVLTSESEGVEDLDLRLCTSVEELKALLGSGQLDHVVVELHSECLPQDQVADLMRACFLAGVRFGAFPRVKSLLPPGTEVNHVEGTGFLSYHPPILSRTSLAMKRAMDLVLTSLLLVVFALPMALIALAIKLDSSGPVLYRQVRVGKYGQRFHLFKFRTMVPDADDLVAELMLRSSDPDWLIIDDDPRVTRLGRLIRRASLDELPQLWNVIKGEMSLVGPRPLPERDDDAVRGWGRHRLDLTPGVTGHWQVLGRSRIPFREMVEIDYAYVTSWSFSGDIKLLIRTVPAVLKRRGAN